MHFLIKIFFILLLNKKIISFINLPFKTFINNSKINSSNFISHFKYTNIFTELQIGTPPQKLNFQISMSDFHSIIISNFSKNCEIKFFQNNSKTFEETYSNLYDYNLKFTDLSVFAKDLISINKNVEFYFNFFLAFDTINNISAILGFQLNDNYQKVNFIHQLKKSNFIKQFDFYFNFDEFNINNINDLKGEIIIGNFPHNFNKKFDKKNLIFVNSNFINNNNNNKQNFIINFDNIFINKKLIFNNVNAQILFEQFFISANFEFLEIFKEIFKEFLNEKICFENINNDYKKEIFFFCKKKPKFSKEIIFNVKDKKNFTLNFDDLFLKINNFFYFLIVFENSKNFILGNIFLQKNLLIFNQDKKQIGFYIKKEKNYFILIQTFIIFLCVFVIIILLYFMKKILINKRKIKANELEENFEYSSKLIK